MCAFLLSPTTGKRVDLCGKLVNKSTLETVRETLLSSADLRTIVSQAAQHVARKHRGTVPRHWMGDLEGAAALGAAQALADWDETKGGLRQRVYALALWEASKELAKLTRWACEGTQSQDAVETSDTSASPVSETERDSDEGQVDRERRHTLKTVDDELALQGLVEAVGYALDANQRTVVYLRHWQDETIGEIALKTGQTERQVRQTLATAYALLAPETLRIARSRESQPVSPARPETPHPLAAGAPSREHT